MAGIFKNRMHRPYSMKARYERAQALMQGIFTKKMVLNATLYPIWIDQSDCFWYERETRKGKEYRLVNAKTATNDCAFDHETLASALAKVAAQTVNAANLPISNICMALNPSDLSLSRIRFSAFGKRWIFDTQPGTCQEVEASLEEIVGPEDEVMSPDGHYTAFTRDHNLWVRDLSRGEEQALTFDGKESYVYGAPASAWGHPHGTALQVRWSPDSKQIFTVQRDTRQVQTLPMIQHVPKDGSLRPTVKQIKIAYPGDENIEELRLLSIDIDTGHIQAADYRQIPVTRNGDGFFTAGLGWWATDSRRTYFVDVERDYKTVRVVEFDTRTGATRILFEETTDTHINLMLNNDEYPTLVPVPERNELIWFSERSGWAHLYLYDLESGKLKHPITQGDWLVRDIVCFDPTHREVFVQTGGRNPDIDPYYRDLVRVNIDSGELTTIASSDHDIIAFTKNTMAWMFAKAFGKDPSALAISNNGNFAVVTRTRADEVPVSLLVDRDGRDIMELETADVSALPDGWQWPEPVKLLAADNKTDIYGLMFRPSYFSPDQNYPIVSHVFNTPELPWVSKGSFTNGTSFGWPYLDAAALAELGFIVVQIDGRGTPFRHKAFHDESYGWAPSASNLDDHIAGIRQLAKRYPYMDLERVGITSHASGGPGGVQGLLEHPDFYSVGVSAVQHDSRFSSASMWGEKYEGLFGPSSNYCYPEELAENLKGKLLMMQGMLDRPQTVFRVIEALHKANKDFDLILLPNLGHGMSSYLIRRAWDYLVRHLLNAEPPKEFKLITGIDKPELAADRLGEK